MLQVVARHNHRSSRLLVVVEQHLLQHVLASGVEEVERLVESNQFGAVQQCGNDAHLMSVAGREVAYVLLLVEYLAVHKWLEAGQAFCYLLLRHARHTSDEVEVFFCGEEVDEETVVDVRTGICLPVLAQCRVDCLRGAFRSRLHCHYTLVRLQKVEHKAEQRCLAGTIVAD